eukprot:12066172-Alexandrium_andersonii.AAC.1
MTSEILGSTMRSPWRTKPFTRERRRPQTMRRFGRLSGPILLTRASLLIRNSRAPSCALRLSSSSHLTAQPWLAIPPR